MSQALTFADVAKHISKEDLYIVLGNSVYDVSSFIEEHPGGEEILLEVAGQDATESFNVANHTRNAFSILSELRVGNLQRASGDPAPIKLKRATASDGAAAKKPHDMKGDSSSLGCVLYIVAILLGGLIASAAFLSKWSEP